MSKSNISVGRYSVAQAFGFEPERWARVLLVIAETGPSRDLPIADLRKRRRQYE
jgi:hypothetical protein